VSYGEQCVMSTGPMSSGRSITVGGGD
jgi:hypothetical protein